MNAEELRTKTAAELHEELQSVLKEQFSLRMQKGIGQLTQTDQLRRLRRDVARINTVLNEKAGESA